jgi:hypothetical protein
MRECISYSQREVLHNILIEIGVPMNLVRLIKMCFNAICSKIDTINNTEDITDTSKEAGLELNADKTEYMSLFVNRIQGKFMS